MAGPDGTHRGWVRPSGELAREGTAEGDPRTEARAGGESAGSYAAVQQMSGEDLMVLRRMIKAGRPLLASTERESQAVAAYRSAVEKVIRSTDDSSKRGN